VSLTDLFRHPSPGEQTTPSPATPRTDDPSAVEPGEVLRAIGVDVVDAALRQIGGRRRFTHREAGDILDDVRAQIDEVGLGAATVRALDAAVAAVGTDPFVERRRLVDALLDVRHAVGRGARRARP